MKKFVFGFFSSTVLLFVLVLPAQAVISTYVNSTTDDTTNLLTNTTPDAVTVQVGSLGTHGYEGLMEFNGSTHVILTDYGSFGYRADADQTLGNTTSDDPFVSSSLSVGNVVPSGKGASMGSFYRSASEFIYTINFQSQTLDEIFVPVFMDYTFLIDYNIITTGSSSAEVTTESNLFIENARTNDELFSDSLRLESGSVTDYQAFDGDEMYGATLLNFKANTDYYIELGSEVTARTTINQPGASLAADGYAYADPIFIIDPNWMHADEFTIDFSLPYESYSVSSIDVPEPSSLLLMGLGLVGLGFIRRRKAT